MTQPAKHKLTTVLFADIQGYTALMHRDESQALDLLNRFKAELERAIPLHEGKIIQYYGDGCLASFDSTANAAACSIVLQQAFQDEIPVRIGLHLGEVLFQENNIYGDAVNIASRIESMGVSGSVLLSGNVYEQIRNKGNFEFSNLGSYRFKNVEKPMAVFGLSNPGLAVPSRMK